jgi:hypothetical protein
MRAEEKMSVADTIGPNSSGTFAINVASIDIAGVPFTGGTPNGIGVVATASGIWAAPQPINYTITYLGSPGVTPTLVTVTFTNVSPTATNPGFVTISPNLPLNLTPANNPNYPIMAVDNGQDVAAYVDVNSIDGQMFVETVLNDGSFSGTGASGWNAFSFSYSV